MGAREAIAKAILAGKPGGPHPGGIHVYHSSPHDFDKFDWSKLRTGEGANVYGSGFYFAENPAVSGQGGQYWNQFLNRFSGDEMGAADRLRAANFDRAAAAADVQKRLDDVKNYWKDRPFDERYVPTLQARARNLEDRLALLKSGAPVGPRTYEVNINARPELMLDWDKPMPTMGRYGGNGEETAGAVLQRANRSPIHAGDLLGVDSATPEQLSRGLAERGIPGIRYLDQGSRGPDFRMNLLEERIAREKAQGLPFDHWQKELDVLKATPPSYNYVVTDPSKLDILAKYGIVGGAPVGMGALAAQDQYGAPP